MSDLQQVLLDAAASGTGPASVDDLHTSLVRRRRRRTRLRSAAAVVVAAVSVSAVALVASRSGGSSAVPPVRGSHWQQLPPSPLSPRVGPLAVAVGDEVLFFGGSTAHVCPPNADCSLAPESTKLRDGAAYNLTTRTWRRLATAPAFPQGAVAVVDGVVHLIGYRNDTGGIDPHLAYDIASDSWAVLPGPHQQGSFGRPFAAVAAGDRLIATGTGYVRDQVYDPVRKVWDELPQDPATPYGSRSLAWTGTQLVALGPRGPKDFDNDPLWVRASTLDLATGRWTRLPDSTATVDGQTGHWSWDGHELVNADRQTFSYKTLTPPVVVKLGGVLDVTHARWSELPDPPAAETPEQNQVLRYSFSISADGLRYKASDHLYFFDSQQGRWIATPSAPREVGFGAGQAWVGDQLVVWGGAVPYTRSSQHGGGPIGTGAVYRP